MRRIASHFTSRGKEEKQIAEHLIRENQSNLCKEPPIGHEDIAGTLHIVTLEEGREV